LSERIREKMGYHWQQSKNKKEVYKPSEPLKCALCGKVITPGTLPHLLYGKGFVCEDCSKRYWKKIKKK
jgi:hypothetical protein